MAPPNQFSTQNLTISELKANKHSMLMIIELGLPVLESSTDSEHKFHKTGIKNWLPIGYNLGSF